MVSRLTIAARGNDPRAAALTNDAHHLGIEGVLAIEVADIVFVAGALDSSQLETLTGVLVEPLLQTGTWDVPVSTGAVVETVLQPGVTDPVAHEVVRVATEIGLPVEAAATGVRYTISGNLTDGDHQRLVQRLLANAVIERWCSGEIEPPFDTAQPELVAARTIPVRGCTPEELAAVNVERGMYLDPEELLALQARFEDEGRNPTDVELETIAQTWSEHCAHKTFRARITTTSGDERPSLLKRLRDTTDAIDAAFVVSSFVGNAGIVTFQAGRTLALKAETHNHPSAIEPFGGANTGVGGVIRDILGAAHHPIACTDILCFGPADLPAAQLPDGVLHPRRIRSGVIAGVADYGNKMGLPTVAGAVLYDPAYTANPLVFCGCIGVADVGPALPGPQTGDRVIAIGGRTGRDGLRGATFSSATMDATTGEVAGASVQIGDPITEKLVMEVLAEAQGLFTSITDCGAGGFSSAIGEMAEGVGARIELSSAPLKYAGLSAWEIWLSEAQERMVLSVDPAQVAAVQAICDRHGVELTDLGEFTGDNRLVVTFQGDNVLDLDTTFLHDGRPQRSMVAELPMPSREVDRSVKRVVADPAETLLSLLAHPNIASKEAVIHRYDHAIRGTTVVGPLTGVDYGAPSDGVVLVEPSDTEGFAIGIGVNPWQGLYDPYRMAYAAVDEAIRNAVVAGADPDRVALLDNFSWGDPRRRSTLGELVEAVEGCCDAAIAYNAPFVSGKDSLNNEYLGSDGERHAVPPTLVITAVAHVPDAGRVVTSDLKAAGNQLLLLGTTDEELAGSHLDKVLGEPGAPGVVAAPDAGAPGRYRALHRAILDGLVTSAHDCSEGGLAVALAEMCIGGQLGVEVTALPHEDLVVALFSESASRIIVEVAPQSVDAFAAAVPGPVQVIGTVTASPSLVLPGLRPLDVTELAASWRST